MATHLPADYYTMAHDCGTALARAGFGVVYGGANKGLMGTVADAALAAGGRVTGVIPMNVPALVPHTHNGLTELVRAADMPERKKVMYERGDSFVALPGGYGTLEEVFEILDWRKIGLHNKQLYFLNHHGFWNPLMQMLAHFITMRTMNPEHLHYFTFVQTVDELMSFLQPTT
jgi:uncharacterized protein (TIGR00730 family)